ncbi:MAG: glycosyltransferase family 4 protein [Burkholderiaceae bacterium]|nr:glycosyltransferase family 4 protein [Burkholderiaceae bacterium]
MNIAIVYQYYQGHGEPGHSLVYEYAHHLADLGHRVTVVSGETGYMRRDGARAPWHRRLIRRQRDGAVEVIRTFTYSALHRSYLGRLLAFVSFSIGAPIGLLLAPRPDVVFSSSPPLFPMVPALVAARMRRSAFVFEVRDLWPASAVELGIVRSRALIGLMSMMERALYRRSDRVVALTEGIRDDIVGRGWPARRVTTVTCGVDLERMRMDPAGRAQVRESRGWQASRVVMYFGAIGEANNMPVILRAAERLRDRADIRFVIVGDGLKREATISQRDALGLGNVEVLPPVAKGDASAFLSAADLCLVTLRDVPLFAGAIPTKLLDYMACERPVVAGLRGEGAAILEQAGAGVCFEPDDDQALAERITHVLGDPDAAQAMGRRGRAHVAAHFDARRLREKLAGILEEVVASRRERA